MNKVMLLGRMVRDPEIRFTQSAEPLAVCRFTIAVDRPISKANQDKTADFINCICFGKRGETIGEYFSKGNKIAVIGRIQVSNYTDKSGNNRYSTDVVVEEFDFCESRNTSSEQGEPASKNNGKNSKSNPQPQEETLPMDDMNNEELPF